MPDYNDKKTATENSEQDNDDSFDYELNRRVVQNRYIVVVLSAILLLLVGAASFLFFFVMNDRSSDPNEIDAEQASEIETSEESESSPEAEVEEIVPIEVVKELDSFEEGIFENTVSFVEDEISLIALQVEKLDFEKSIIAENFDSARSVHSVDIDNDGDFDVLGAARYVHQIALWRNDGVNIDTGEMNFTKIIIDGQFNGAFSVHGADLDNDGFKDIIGASLYDEQIAWWRNEQDGTFGEKNIIDIFFDGAIYIYCADVNNDGFLDVLAAGEAVDQVAWWKNDNGRFVDDRIVIGDKFDGARSVHTADIDGDGDLDVVGTARFADKVNWWENTGTGEEFIEHILDDTFDGPRSAHATDIDGDGDIDVIAAARYSHQIAIWYNDGNQIFSKTLIDKTFEGATNVISVDMDKDGHKDILAAAVYANKIAWWQNKGNGQFVKFIIGENFTGATFVYPEDINGDSFKDVLVPAVFDNQIGLWMSTPQYKASGSFVSAAIEIPENYNLGKLSWSGTVPENTRMQFQIRSANSIEELTHASWHGALSTEDFYTTSNSTVNPVHNEHTFFQFRVLFDTADLEISPSLNSVTATYLLKI